MTTVSDTMHAVEAIVAKQRFPLHDEKDTQALLESLLTAAGMTFSREHKLAPGDIVDFLVGDKLKVAVELKIKGRQAQIMRQCERYAQHSEVSGLLLLTSRAIQMPKSFCGKPVAVVSLSAGWL